MAKEKVSKVKNENKHFMKDVKAELKRVVWPSSKQMVSNVTAVITIVLVTVAIVFCLDFVFESLNRYGINKIKENVQPKNNQEQVQTVEPATDNTSDDQNNGTDEASEGEETVTTEEVENNN